MYIVQEIIVIQVIQLLQERIFGVSGSGELHYFPLEASYDLSLIPSPKEKPLPRSLSEGEGGQAAFYFSASLLTNHQHINVQQWAIETIGRIEAWLCNNAPLLLHRRRSRRMRS